MADETEDQEVAAIKTLLDALTPLKPEARSNVIEYVFRRLGITTLTASAAMLPAPAAVTPVAPTPHQHSPSAPADLRTLREQKQPKSTNQMVALLGYYLANLAPPAERRDYVVADDIKRYFPQANFELPTGSHNQTLVNAKNSGYFDIVGAGQYRLNPVGHNLVTHKLPRGDGAPNRGARRPKKAHAKKTKKKAST